MSCFAKVVGGKVVNVISADQEFIDNMVDTSPGRWIETFKDGSQRKNFASKGGNYDISADAFYAKKPFDSWTLNTTTYQWEPPVAYPSDGDSVGYSWNEETTSWDAVE